MAYTIERRFIPGLPKIALKGRRYIIAHEAGNPNNTGPNSIENEISYMRNNWKTAFVTHWVGGGGRIVQVAANGYMQYGAGPKANPYAYAQVELARTNNKETFKKDYAAFVWLLRELAKEAGLPVSLDAGTSAASKGIKTHDWIRRYVGGTTHVDPYGYLATFGVSKAEFKRDIEQGVPAMAAATTGAWDERYGNTGARVGTIQTNLKTLGYYTGAVDNSFGPAMLAAVKAFQKAQGLTADGIFGPASQKAMDKALAGHIAKTSAKASAGVDLQDIIVLHSERDFPAALRLHKQIHAPIYLRDALEGKTARHAYVIGGRLSGMGQHVEKSTLLSGTTWEDTVAEVYKFVKAKK